MFLDCIGEANPTSFPEFFLLFTSSLGKKECFFDFGHGADSPLTYRDTTRVYYHASLNSLDSMSYEWLGDHLLDATSARVPASRGDRHRCGCIVYAFIEFSTVHLLCEIIESCSVERVTAFTFSFPRVTKKEMSQQDSPLQFMEYEKA